MRAGALAHEPVSLSARRTRAVGAPWPALVRPRGALLCLVDGHAAWATGVVALAEGDGAELRLRVVVRNRFPALAALCARAGGACLVQTLRLHAL